VSAESVPLSALPELGLAGQRAVVTGGAGGIGLAIARRLRACGAYVIVVDRDEQALRSAFPNDECAPVRADIAADAADLADRLLRDHGPISLVVNNVGVTTPHRFLELESRDYHQVFGANLDGPWFFTRQLARGLVRASVEGSILFISSVHDTFIRMYPHYSTSKAATAMLVRELAYELAPHRIRVNAISPGWIRTGEDPPDERLRKVTHQVPAGVPGEPDDVARLAVVLLSNAWSGYVTGANLTVDGGLSLHNWLMDL
jgi:NAD(P)-dependent dehydrogenase (short-subunit alcohol dehydrogenase family)